MLKRFFAVFAVAALALVTLATPARAATPEALKAADYIVSEAPAPTLDTAGNVADEVLALATTNDSKYESAIASRLTFLEQQAAPFIEKSGESAAAKLAVVAVATGKDPKAFGGVDLVAKIKAGIKPDGAFGAFPGPFASGMAMVALARAGEEIPATMTTYLLTYRATDNGFSYQPKQATGDADNTALAVLGLQAAKSSDPALAAAIAWLETNQQADGSWAGYAPVNSTGVSAGLVSGDRQDKAAQYVISHQLPTGALKTGEKGKDEPNLMATVQGILALTKQTYLTIEFKPDASSSPSPSATSTGSARSDSGNTAGLIAAAIAAVLGIGLIAVTGRSKA